jgi:c-di-GMP-binding flagellar brake protein YcgR
MASRQQSSNVRKYARILTLNMVSYRAQEPDGKSAGAGIGRTLDLSPGGIKLEVSHRYPLSSELELNLQVKEKIIRVRGRVVHLEELKNGKIGVGIQFSRVSKEDKDFIENFLATK